MFDVMKTKVLEVVTTSGEFEVWAEYKGETLEEVLHTASILLHKWCAPNEIFGGDPVFEDDNGGYHLMTVHATLFDADADGNITEDEPDPDYPVKIKRWLHAPEIRGPLPTDSDELQELAGVMLRREGLGDPLFRTEKGHYTLRVVAVISPVEADDEIVRELLEADAC